jgi:large subunit ribosomal protein L4
MSAEETTPVSELTVPRKNPRGELLGYLAPPKALLDARVRYRLLKEALVMYAANRRVGTAETKTRADVAGTTRKPWKQKGTGRARAGSKKSPLWRGGGTVFGPHPRDYSYAINRKQRRLALRSALFGKLRDGQLVVLEGFELEKPRTKAMAELLAALGIEGRCLLGTAGAEPHLYLSARNLPGVTVRRVADFNAEEVAAAGMVVLTREAFDRLEGLGENASLPAGGEDEAGEAGNEASEEGED